MIEGLRLLPWLQRVRREEKDPKMLDCTACQRTTTSEERVAMACGLLPRDERVGPWLPPGLSWPEAPDGTRRLPTVCIGYLTSLPEVREVARAHVHWADGRGTLRDRYGGQEPTEVLLDGLEALQGSVWELDAWLTRPKESQ